MLLYRAVMRICITSKACVIERLPLRDQVLLLEIHELCHNAEMTMHAVVR